MKKIPLLLTLGLLVALPTALFAQLSNISAEGMLSNGVPGGLTMGGYFASSTLGNITITGSYADGTLTGINISNSFGFGVSVGPAGVSVSGSGLTISIGYNLSIQQDGSGNSVMSLSYGMANLAESSETGVVNIGFETLGLDASAAAVALSNPATANAALALLNNDSSDFQNATYAACNNDYSDGSTYQDPINLDINDDLDGNDPFNPPCGV